MIEIIVLDAAVLSSAAQRTGVAEAEDCRRWIAERLAAGVQILVPAIIHYEVRRELLRAGKTAGIARLERFINAEPSRYIPLTDEALLQTAVLWAQARQQGFPTADDKELDIDVILAAQVLCLNRPLNRIVVATSNVRHIRRFVPADVWTNLRS